MSTPDAPVLPAPPGGRDPDRCRWLRTADGIRIRCGIWYAPAPRGHVIYLNGRSEFIEKASIPAAAFVERGFSVATVDWRGQGLSDRLAEPALKGHVRHFDDYQTDLRALLRDPEIHKLAGPRVLVGHSMGACIGVQGLQDDALSGDTAAVILSGPMFGVALPPGFTLAAGIVAFTARLMGRLDRWPPFGDVRTPYVLTAPEENVLTSDAAVWSWLVDIARSHPEVTIGAPTIGWFREAMRAMEGLEQVRPLRQPSLCLVGADEKVVDHHAITTRCKTLGTPVTRIPDARHEVLIEAQAPRRIAWQAIDRLLEDLPPKR